MPAQQVYIVEMGRCLPNEPVDNNTIEQRLGLIDGRASRAKRVTLRNNGIQTRYYALDPVSGEATHNNAQLAALAVRETLRRADVAPEDCDLLACGTSSPDQLKPGHGSMVHGELAAGRFEVVSTSGVCGAGMAALKYAFRSVKSGEAGRALACGSELASSFMLARNFSPESEASLAAAQQRPGLAFEKDFLRWMLSDGAGAALLANQAPTDGERLALRIDWIDGISLASELPVCMYSGAVKTADGRLQGWREAPSPQDVMREHYFAVKQDARLLNDSIPRLVAPDTQGAIARRRGLNASDIDWFLPHYSSDYFRSTLTECLAAVDLAIPAERWFSNLASVGNVGSASIYLMLEELLHGGRLRRGQRLLCFVPESARFSVDYMHLTVV